MGPAIRKTGAPVILFRPTPCAEIIEARWAEHNLSLSVREMGLGRRYEVLEDSWHELHETKTVTSKCAQHHVSIPRQLLPSFEGYTPSVWSAELLYKHFFKPGRKVTENWIARAERIRRFGFHLNQDDLRRIVIPRIHLWSHVEGSYNPQSWEEDDQEVEDPSVE
ncbi:hypothetical protein R3P38DRAFT_3271297 [Favolaschia claudopus]|uniref:Uncharacterized protein n=1 Tax=Favolaschia claudopus TaxID=2862362 RepID=A0AAW0BAB8_9AGAR